MKTLKQSFASAKAAEQFLRKIRPMVAWTDLAANHPCSIVARSDYPLEVPSIEHCRFRGIESIESKFKTKSLPDFQEALAGSFGSFLANSGSAHFMFRAHDPKRIKRRALYAFSIKKSELLIRFVPACGTSDVEVLRTEYDTFFKNTGLSVATKRTAHGITFKSQDAFAIKGIHHSHRTQIRSACGTSCPGSTRRR